MLLHDNHPHTPPSSAWLRWRENWIFFLIDRANDICATFHMSLQPTHDIARATANLLIGGERHFWHVEIACPQTMLVSPVVTIDRLTFDFTHANAILVKFAGEEHALDLVYEGRMHVFDYLACRDVNPDAYSSSENVTMGTGIWRHQNQACDARGSIRWLAGERSGQDSTIAGTGYRDHSWGMRNDERTLEHVWTWMIFPDRVFHMMRVVGTVRPGSTVREGYYGTSEGNMALRTSSVEQSGDGGEGMPAVARHRMEAYDGQIYTVDCHVGERFGRIGFLSQAPGSHQYLMHQNFCTCTLVETGEKGHAMFEWGWRSIA